MNPLLWLLGGAVVVVAAGGKSGGVNAIVGIAPAAPEPPAQEGASPHPQKPEDPNAGRLFTFMGLALTYGKKTTHERPLVDVAQGEEAQMLVDVWEVDYPNDQLCTASRYVLTIANGRVFSTKVLTPDTLCSGAIGKAQQGYSRKLRFISRGATVTLVIDSTGETNVDENIGGNTGLEPFAPEDQPYAGVYLDAQWQVL